MSQNRFFHGLTSSAMSRQLRVVLEAIKSEYQQILVVVPTQTVLEEVTEDLSFFGTSLSVKQIPSYEMLPFEPTSPARENSAIRNYNYRLLYSGRAGIYISTISTLFRNILPKDFYLSKKIDISISKPLAKDTLSNIIADLGYHRTSNVNQLGEYTIRGGIIDVFAPAYSLPLRLKYLADTLQSIYYFDPSTQRSLEQHIEQAEIDPVRERLYWNEIVKYSNWSSDQLVSHFKSYVNSHGIPRKEQDEIISAFSSDLSIPGIEMYQHIFPVPWHSITQSEVKTFLIDRHLLNQVAENLELQIDERYLHLVADHQPIPTTTSIFIKHQELLNYLDNNTVRAIDNLLLDNNVKNSTKIFPKSLSEMTIKLKQGDKRTHPFAPLAKALKSWRRSKYNVSFVIGGKQRADRLQRILLELDFDVPIKTNLSGGNWEDLSSRYPVVILLGRLSEGFILPKENLVYISEKDIFGEHSRNKRGQKIAVKRILDSLSQLAPGDYVVHTDYGIGRYQGFTQRILNGIGTDLLQIEYEDSTLLLPMANISKIERFSALEGQHPRLDKLSSTRWQKTKQRVRKSVEVLAGDLVRLYAARSLARGWRFDPAGAEDERFADGFPYQETVDQLDAINATLNDMAKDKPMDRLICGDVGFGKTEVAMRAAFKATQHSKQVAVLAPTTILADQHYKTFSARFAEFPIKVGAISRFYSATHNKETIAATARGEIDILIGTHKILQNKVEFTDLGLVIVDEEHRFGVKQKERLKQMKKEVDILTLTATPIPRTLHMSLLNLREISVLQTPPVDRKVIKTFVASDDESTIRDAIMREMQRNGQIFFVHNRVQGLEAVSSRLSELIPEARIAHAHGQMSEEKLEKIMVKFLDHQIDILVCTTIIESGIDIPRANTIIIDRAHQLGLSQLYQLRGRVGRSTRQAYCYFLVPKKGRLNLAAQERLAALQSLDELGIGFQLAIRDLEIRGAGNLLGKEQSGNVLAVGFDLYTRILQEAIAYLTGDELDIKALVEPEIRCDFNAYIPEFYIPDVKERMVIYQRLAAIRSEEDKYLLEEEMTDRFGALQEPIENLISLMTFRGQLKKYGVTLCDINPTRTSISFIEKAPIAAEKLMILVKNHPNMIKINSNNTISIKSELIKTDPLVTTFYNIIQFLESVST